MAWTWFIIMLLSKGFQKAFNSRKLGHYPFLLFSQLLMLILNLLNIYNKGRNNSCKESSRLKKIYHKIKVDTERIWWPMEHSQKHAVVQVSGSREWQSLVLLPEGSRDYINNNMKCHQALLILVVELRNEVERLQSIGTLRRKLTGRTSHQDLLI